MCVINRANHSCSLHFQYHIQLVHISLSLNHSMYYTNIKFLKNIQVFSKYFWLLSSMCFLLIIQYFLNYFILFPGMLDKIFTVWKGGGEFYSIIIIVFNRSFVIVHIILYPTFRISHGVCGIITKGKEQLQWR